MICLDCIYYSVEKRCKNPHSAYYMSDLPEVYVKLLNLKCTKMEIRNEENQ